MTAAAVGGEMAHAVRQQILAHQFSNGLALVAEPMPWLESAAFALLVPSGCSRDPGDRLGLSNFTCELVQRGSGTRDSRRFVEDLELLGVDSSASVSVAHSSFSGAMPAESLLETLGIYADLVQRPHLPEDQLEDSRQVCIQEIRSVEDEPAQLVMNELRWRRYGDPWGRFSPGRLEDVGRIELQDVRRHFERFYRPNGCILSVAGRVDWPRLLDRVGELFGSWRSGTQLEPQPVVPRGRYHHLLQASAQTHLAVAYPSVPYSHDDYFQARGAVGVLSDGMSSRLFTEVREKRGLCYAVHASCHSLKDCGSVICYAGTTSERAQETLDVVLAELSRLAAGVEQGELDRLKAKIKSALIMQQESSTARSGAIAADWYYLGRVRTLQEIAAILDGLSCQSINRYLAAHPPGDFTVVTLGEKPLEMPREVS